MNGSPEQYSVLAGYYDRLNSDVDYPGWAGRICEMFRKFGGEGLTPSDGFRPLVLDLACGSGNVTLELDRRGYDMTGVDLSPEMLTEARDKAERSGRNVLWLCQDMRSFELYGTVAAIVCCLDGINYLTDKVGLESCFSLAHNYLDPGGLFIFDVNTPYKFVNIYGGRDYIMESDGVFCGWSNSFNEKTGLCRFDLTFFIEREDGSYIRREETQTERCWSSRTLKGVLKSSGFEILGIFDADGADASENSGCERWFFVARCLK